ncbi:Glucosamine 6-phosphate N-acetyltransferase [Rhynchospora pubera]|uniref:Glucosamine 6-phosphate N-acetyltransferase n=1 Tax=Rhynchospora pubera TaxID=906938 RepID=A0AAV8CAJ4_9POAL|nr:Glucosamine 6-phosphate N-acetyltransferase [Rhynchospora pubera]KAJ4818139.1 Glucosamine 6-phosphate N-acetyltransferase [Rhynchospora pubera]
MGSEALLTNAIPKPQNIENVAADSSQISENGQPIQNCIMHQLIDQGNIQNGHHIENGSLHENADGFSVRRLQLSDHKKGFVELLGQLSPTRPLSQEEFQERFAELVSMGPDHHICVIEDPVSCRVVATGSIFIERKFIRGCSKVGHIEDVVVDKGARGLRLGHRVVKHLVDHAKATGCYKVVLYCKPELREFYQKCGFMEKNVQMAFYF